MLFCTDDTTSMCHAVAPVTFPVSGSSSFCASRMCARPSVFCFGADAHEHPTIVVYGLRKAVLLEGLLYGCRLGLWSLERNILVEAKEEH